jgi:hypothetical protein
MELTAAELPASDKPRARRIGDQQIEGCLLGCDQ